MDTYSIWKEENSEQIDLLINDLSPSYDHVFTDDEISTALFDQQECQV